VWRTEPDRRRVYLAGSTSDDIDFGGGSGTLRFSSLFNGNDWRRGPIMDVDDTGNSYFVAPFTDFFGSSKFSPNGFIAQYRRVAP